MKTRRCWACGTRGEGLYCDRVCEKRFKIVIDIDHGCRGGDEVTEESDVIKQIRDAWRTPPITLTMPDGREATVYRQIMGTARAVIGPPNVGWYDDSW